MTPLVQYRQRIRRERSALPVLAALCVALGADLALARQPSPQPPPERAEKPKYVFSEELAVEWVSVPLVVEPKLGSRRPPPEEIDLGWIDLRVDGRPVAVEEILPPSVPVSLLYLQDVSGSMGVAGRLESSSALFGRIVAHLGAGDEIGVLAFSALSLPETVTFHAEPTKLVALTETWAPWGRSAVRDAAAVAVDHLPNRPGRPAAILVTDGADNASQLSAEAVRRALTGTGIPLYVVAVTPTEEDPRTHAPGAPTTLPELATASGGRYLELDSTGSANEAALAAARIVADLRRQARIGFPTSASGERKLRRIEVRLARSGYDIHYRSHYYGFSPNYLEPPGAR